MTKTIHVTLDTTVSPPTLKLEHYGHVHVDKAGAPQTITWALKGALAQGKFSTPGFSWRDAAPKPGIFGPLDPAQNGKSLSLTDNHQDAGSDGDFPYQLSVDYGGTTYTSPPTTGADAKAPSTGTMLLMRDPIIINH